MLDELVTISKFLSLGEAKLAQGKLVCAGISAFVCDENMHAMNWHMGMALEVLDDFEPDGSEASALDSPDGEEDGDMEEVACCPECESLEIREVPSSSPRQIMLWSAAIPFPEAPAQTSRRWRCLMCGYQWREAEE
jgi:hypothetical protein